jgi:radical SAM-linked protein
MRFASHRDVARAMERAVRKAGLPIAYSAGFTPHPKISYDGAAATGMASEAEYLELVLTSHCAPGEVRALLDAALPDGIDVIDVADRGAARPAPLEVSEWQVTLPGVSAAAAQSAVGEFLAAGTVEVERLTKNGTRRVDARAAVMSMEVAGCGGSPSARGYEMLRMVVRHMTPAVRPDDILAALRSVADLRGVAGFTPSAPPLVTRLAQSPLGQGPLDGAGASREREA